MRYDPSLGSDPSQPDGKRLGKARATLCLSSQVGCSMGCTFCATGTMGLKSSLLPAGERSWPETSHGRAAPLHSHHDAHLPNVRLSSAEMVEQMAHACLYSTTPVRNIVFMGMGEPLDAYDEVCEAIRMLTKQTLFGVSHKHLTVSTVGVIPRIRQLAHDLPAVRLALSLHAPSQPLRQQIVPTAKAWDLDRLLAAVREWQDATGQGVFVEYVLLHGVNDALSQARELADLLTSNGIRATVNLIPWNPVLADEGIVFEAPGEEHSLAFRAVLSEAGIRCTSEWHGSAARLHGACTQPGHVEDWLDHTVDDPVSTSVAAQFVGRRASRWRQRAGSWRSRARGPVTRTELRWLISRICIGAGARGLRWERVAGRAPLLRADCPIHSGSCWVPCGTGTALSGWCLSQIRDSAQLGSPM